MAFDISPTLEIDAPASTVWRVITDFPGYRDWNTFVLECNSSLEPGEPIDLLVALGRKAKLQREWIKSHTPGNQFSYAMKPVPLGALSSLRSHHVESSGANSCRYHSHWELRGWLMPLVRLVLGARLRSGFAAMNEGVKHEAEKRWQEQQKIAKA